MAGKVSLDGIALVTGAASGIGKETAFAFAEAGAKGVAFADMNEEGALAAAEESKKFAVHDSFKAIAVKVDITDEASVDNMVQTTLDKFGRIDYSVNSAGIGNLSVALSPNIDADVFSRTLEINVRGTMLCVCAVSKAMAAQEPRSYESRRFGTRSLGRGSIVNVGSVNSYVAAPGMMPYTTSKHAIIGITKSAALDLLPSNIRVNTVCPSWVDTPMMQKSLERVPKLGAMIKAVSPLKRAAVPEEVVGYIIFLSGPSGSYINGTGLVADAGATLTVHL